MVVLIFYDVGLRIGREVKTKIGTVTGSSTLVRRYVSVPTFTGAYMLLTS